MGLFELLLIHLILFPVRPPLFNESCGVLFSCSSLPRVSVSRPIFQQGAFLSPGTVQYQQQPTLINQGHYPLVQPPQAQYQQAQYPQAGMNNFNFILGFLARILSANQNTFSVKNFHFNVKFTWVTCSFFLFQLQTALHLTWTHNNWFSPRKKIWLSRILWFLSLVKV